MQDAGLRKETLKIYKNFFNLKERCSFLEDKIRKLNQKIRLLESEKHQKESSINLLVSRGYTARESSFIVTGKSPKNVTAADVHTGLVLKSMSNKGYNFLRKSKKVYMPSRTTLTKFKRNHHIRFGFQNKLLR